MATAPSPTAPARRETRLGPWWLHAGPAMAATAVVHLLFLSTALGTDEGGFAMVARLWNEPGPYLYGPQWVDRPPLLIALFAVADNLGPYGVRLVAMLCAVLFVAATAWAAYLAGGRTASGWAAWTAAALSSSTLFSAFELNGELAAIPFVATSVAMTLASVRRPGARGLMLAGGAGAAATSALLVKQNFVGGFAFAVVYLLLTSRRRIGWSRGARLIGAWAGGAVIAAAPALVWATTRPGGVGGLVYAMYGFRLDAAAVMSGWSFAAPERRLGQLGIFAVVSGLLPVLVVVGFAHARRLRHPDPMPWAMGATLLTDVVGVVAGGNFWGHYLIGLAPIAALAVGLGSRRMERGWRFARAGAIFVVTSMLLTSLGLALSGRASQGPEEEVAQWLRASAAPSDTLTIPFSHAGVIETSGLVPAYPYSWSLPVRTLDPHLDLLVATLRGTHAPTWVVRWDSPDAWGLDRHDRVDAVLRTRYAMVARVCGKPVWLRDGAERNPAPPVAGSACDAGFLRSSSTTIGR